MSSGADYWESTGGGIGDVRVVLPQSWEMKKDSRGKRRSLLACWVATGMEIDLKEILMQIRRKRQEKK